MVFMVSFLKIYEPFCLHNLEFHATFHKILEICPEIQILTSHLDAEICQDCECNARSQGNASGMCNICTLMIELPLRTKVDKLLLHLML